MKKHMTAAVLFIAFLFIQNAFSQSAKSSTDLSSLLENYFKERMQLMPGEATSAGFPGHNDKLYADFTDSYRRTLRDFFSGYLSRILEFDRNELDRNDQLSYDIFKREMVLAIEGIDVGYFEGWYQQHRLMPFNQFSSIPLRIAQLGSGAGDQPFNGVKDYQDWQKRVTAFAAWADSAIVYFRKGMAENVVLPEALVLKMIPQMEAMVVGDVTKSLFYGPVNKMPSGFSNSEKEMFKKEYIKMINGQIIPTYKKLADFFKYEYLPKARKSTGLASLANGQKQYQWLIQYWTTTDKTPGEIYKIGLSEVKRIRHLMDSVRVTVGFTGDLKAFFAFMKTDKQFMPFRTPEEVLNAYREVETKIDPNLKRMFGNVPKTKFEVRQTEAFRAASASAEYSAGLPDGTRAGIFYVPIIDATTFNVTTGIEGLFLHEAIPGHHYQMSLQNENTNLPTFRRFFLPGAYGEGWGLYSESLGKELGVYTDPYQYIGALVKEIHRAIRLVVDVGMHTSMMTREQAITYMMENMPLDEAGVVAEIERYMAVPAQALSYKIGSLKIQELRNKYQQQLGLKFNLASFHDAILADGPMSLETLEKKMDAWASAINLT
jgi:uncharacterized protein (DUF885 family)